MKRVIYVHEIEFTLAFSLHNLYIVLYINFSYPLVHLYLLFSHNNGNAKEEESILPIASSLLVQYIVPVSFPEASW